jgi:hypothetical protein
MINQKLNYFGIVTHILILPYYRKLAKETDHATGTGTQLLCGPSYHSDYNDFLGRASEIIEKG